MLDSLSKESVYLLMNMGVVVFMTFFVWFITREDHPKKSKK